MLLRARAATKAWAQKGSFRSIFSLISAAVQLSSLGSVKWMPFDDAPNRLSFIAGLCSPCDPIWTGLQTSGVRPRFGTRLRRRPASEPRGAANENSGLEVLVQSRRPQ